MCLIITQPAGRTLSRAHLVDIYGRNGDGFGIMRAIGGKLHVWRTVGDVADMLALYYAHAAGRACVLHWRMATHGDVNVANAHPFVLTSDIAVVHNGMLDVGTPTRGMSDTWHMAHHVLAPIARDNPDALFSADMERVLGGMIGTTNKLVFAHADGRVAIVNRAAGVEHDGCWYSNTYAWRAPSHLTAGRTRYGTSMRGWLHDDDAWGVGPVVHTSTHTTARADVVSDTCAPCDFTLELDGGNTDPDAMMRQCIRDELVAAAERDGETGVLSWVRDYPGHAADVLAEFYRITHEDAERAAIDTPETVAGWIHEIAPVLTD